VSHVRALFLLIFLPLWIGICSLAAFLVFGPFLSRKACDKLISVWAKTMLRLSGVRVRLLGAEKISGLGSAILVSNHLSHFDIPVLYACLPMSFRMAAKAELFKIPFFGRALRSLGFFPVEREVPTNTMGTLRNIQGRFERSEWVWMAPEGTRQAQAKIGDFKMGAFFLAIKAGRPIVPVVIYGTQEVLPKNSFFVNSRSWHKTVTVRILDPVPVSQWPMSARHEFRDHVRNQMIREFAELSQNVLA
jgi:1-acyl-sn-glycerol-3-phosphate acyltransferase